MVWHEYTVSGLLLFPMSIAGISAAIEFQYDAAVDSVVTHLLLCSLALTSFYPTGAPNVVELKYSKKGVHFTMT